MIPIRNLGSLGIITDVHPYDLPPQGISAGNNVRFQDGKIGRTPAFRSLASTTALVPRHLFTYQAPGERDRPTIVNDDGTIYEYINEVQTNVSPVGFSGTSSSVPFTDTFLHGIAYLNRADLHPLYRTPTATKYAELDNWGATWRCRALRAFKDYLLALNVTKDGVSYPTLIKWSDTTQYGLTPGSWDHTSTTNNAGENTPGDARTPFLDGQPLRNSFIVYNDHQAYSLLETGTYEVFALRKLFDNRGIINTNCVVEVKGLHYVFGVDDIYVHDGVTHRSICEGRVKDHIFGNMSYLEKDAFFVYHNPPLNEIWFCYRSGDGLVNFRAGDYCNRAAVYNYSNDTWGFSDLPNASGASRANVSTFRTYEDITTSYGNTGGTYYEMETDRTQHNLVVGSSSTTDSLTSKLYGLDKIEGGLLPYPLDTIATQQAVVERVGIDMDETGEEIRAYKMLKRVYPQMDDFSVTGISLKFAATDYNVLYPAWGASVAYDPSSSHKADTRVAGRYLGWRVEVPASNDFRFSGFDADIVTISRR